jgi:dolichol-phosphate mannosyltransferase
LVLYVATERLNIYYLISVFVATVVSTLWNFSLTEAWVYRSQQQSQGRFRRLMLFSVMNILALGLRSPVIFAMTTFLGINYLISNLFSLALMTVVRFLTADNLIWKQDPASKLGEKQNSVVKKGSREKVYAYNIHDIVTVVSEGELPELKPFKVNATIDNPTIRVRIGIPRRPKPEDAGHYIRYREILGHLGFEAGIQMGDQVDVIAAPLLRYSPHVLYTNIVEPILRWTMVKKGYALVHGATISFGQDAHLITARTDTGKTTTLLKILSHQRRNNDQAGFLSDDMTVVSPTGVAMTYPKPLTISHHTLRAINAKTLSFKEKLALPLQSRIHSRTGRQVATIISKTHMPAATINMFMQMVIPPPKYFVDQLIPKVKLTQIAHFTGMFIIERGEQGIQTIKNREALEILLSNCEDAYGFPPYNDLKEFLYFDNGVDLREKEQAIIRQAFGGLDATLIRSSNLEWWCQIPAFVSPMVAKDCSCESSPKNQSLQTNPMRTS